METFDWQRALKAGIGVFALGVILAMVLLVGRPAMQTTGPMMGHGAMWFWPTLWVAVLVVGGGALAFGYAGARQWAGEDGAASGDEGEAGSGSGSEATTGSDKIEAIHEAYARGELTEAALEAALERELTAEATRGETDHEGEATREVTRQTTHEANRRR